MTKNINYVSHKKSSKKVNGKPQLPSPGDLVLGEIAINFAENVETLSIKNESGSVVTFSSDNYYTEQKLGSGFTGNNSAKTVTDVIVENEETVSAALNNLKDTKCDLSAETEHYNALNSGLTNVETGLTIVATAVAVINDKVSGKTDVSAFTEHTSNTNLHFSGSEKENLDALATNIAAISGITADKIDSWNAAAGQDLTQYYKKTETSGKTELDTAFSAKADNSDLTTLSGTVTGHTANTDIHVTLANKTAWDAKADLSDIPSVTGYADAVKYNNTRHYVEFYHGTTAGTKVFEYDASPFIIDGMVDDVEIKDVTSGETQVTCLVISFNTDAGKQDINIPISQIFDASNYYTTAQTDTKITEATSGKVDNTTYTAYTAATATEIGNKLATSDFNTYSGAVNTTINSKASQSDLNTLSGTVTAHTADGDIHVTSEEKTTWNNKSNFSGSYNDLTDKPTLFSGDYNDLENKPTIPSKTSDLTNDSDFATSGYVQTVTNDMATQTWVGQQGYLKSADISGKQDVTGMTAYTTTATTSALSGTVTAHTADTTIHVTASDKSKWNNVDSKLNTSDFNTYSGTVDTAIGNKVDKVSGKDLSSNDFTDALKTKLDNIASGAEVNVQADWTETVTTADSYIKNKPTLGTAAAKGVSTGITNSDNLIEAKHIYSGVGVTVAYDSENHYIQLKNTAGSVLSSFDASAFLVDGMVDSVTLETKSGSTYLVITWNIAAGKTKTELNIGDIFEADNYYTTAQTDTAIEAATSGKVDTTTFTAHTASTVHMSATEKVNLDSLATNIAAISGITSTKVSNWDGAATNSHTHTNKSVLDDISSADITNWNSKTSNIGTVTSVQIGLPTGLSAATTAITESGKFDVKFSDGYSIPTTLKQGQWDEAYTAKHNHDNKTVLDGITTAKTSSWDTAATSAHNHSNKSTLDAITASSAAINSLTGAVGTMAFQNANSYSSATQVQTALGKKSDTGHTHVKADITDFPAINDGTFTISGNGASVVSTSANASANKGLNIKSSTNVTITTGASEISIAATDTKYANGNFITITGSNNSINVTTGTTSSSVSRGDHNHDSVYTKITDSEAMEQTLAAAITDIDSRAADKEELKVLVNDYQDFKLMYENRRERKRFTNRDDFFANLKRAAADQNLERYGLKVGDYLNYNGHDYVIAGLNTMRGSYSPYRLTTDHVGLIVIPHTTQAWNVSGNTYQSTYTYATSGGTWTAGAGAGYANSDLHHYMTETLLPIVKTDLGSYASDILKHHKLYSNAVNTSGYNRFGSASGCSSGWAWYENQEICALSEVQVYGSIVWSSSGYDTGEACRQLDVFRVYNMNEIFGWEYPWLRDVASASYACLVDNGGETDYSTASNARCVAALILFA